MKTKREQIFRVLEPPSGGVAKMHAKITNSGRRASFESWWLAPIAVTIIASLTALILRSAQEPEAAIEANSLLASTEFDRLLGRELVPLELSVMRDDRPISVRQLETSDPKVRIYRLEPDSP